VYFGNEMVINTSIILFKNNFKLKHVFLKTIVFRPCFSISVALHVLLYHCRILEVKKGNILSGHLKIAK